MTKNRGVSVGVEITGSAKGFKAASEDAQRATAELKRKTASHSREIEQNFKMVTIAMAKVTAAIILVKKGFEAYGKIMNSTNATGDAFEITQSKIKFSINEVVRSIATADFKGFGERMWEAAEAGEALAKQLDLISDLSLRLKLIESGTELQMKQLELVYKSKANPWQVRIEAAREYLDLNKKLEVEQLKFAQEEVKAALAASGVARAGLSEERLKYYIKNADLLAANEEAVKSYLQTQKDLDEQLALPIKSTGYHGLDIAQNPEKIAELRNQLASATDVVKNFAADYKDWSLVIDPERLGLTNAWAKLDQVMTASAENALKPLRTVNSLLKDEEKSLREIVNIPKADISNLKLPGLSTGIPALPGLRGAPKPEMEGVTDAVKRQKEAINELASAFDNLGNSIGGVEGAWISYISNLAKGISGAITAIAALTTAEKVKAAASAKAAATGAASSVAAIPIVGPILAVAAIASVVAALLAIPKMAEGGIASGPTLAKVGEYPGARTNPEIIAPLSKLKEIIGNNSTQKLRVEVVGTIKGKDIYISNRRYLNELGQNT